MLLRVLHILIREFVSGVFILQEIFRSFYWGCFASVIVICRIKSTFSFSLKSFFDFSCLILGTCKLFGSQRYLTQKTVRKENND